MEKFRFNQKLKMMFISLALVLTMVCAIHGQCDGLKVYMGDTQINTSDVCVKKYNKSDCLNFTRSFNQSDLPQGYPINILSVEKPNDLKVAGLETVGDDGMVFPGWSIRWKNPSSGLSRASCYGYLVTWSFQSPNSNSSSCLLFHMVQGNDTELTFQYDSVSCREDADYSFRTYSMPPAKPWEINNENFFQKVQIKTISSYKATDPADWRPFVTYKTYNNGTVNVGISLPPTNFNITTFKVFLVNQKNINVEVGTESINITEPRTPERTQYFLTLRTNESGSYTIKVWVEDQNRYQNELCQCWKFLNYKKTCQSVCGSTETGYFYLNITEQPVPNLSSRTASAIVTSSDITPVLTTEKVLPTNSSSGSGTIYKDTIPVVIGVFAIAVLILATTMICYFLRNEDKWKKVKKVVSDCLYSSPHHKKPPVVSIEGKPDLDYKDHLPYSSLPKKTVYIMSADDHEDQVKLVNSFAEFLKVHCYCKVILPTDHNQRDVGGFEWFLTSVNKSDYLIFISSVAAKNLINAYFCKRTFKNRIVGPEGDLFSFGLKHILFSEEVREKSVVLVSFHGIQCQKYLQLPVTYMLPNHLPQFLQKIHNLDAAGVKTHNGLLPLEVENIQNLVEGAVLLSACKRVKKFERDNPDWFQENFGEAVSKPGVDRSDSDDSGCIQEFFDSVSQCGSPSTDPHSSPYDHVRPNVAHTEGSGDMFKTFLDKSSCVTVDGPRLISQLSETPLDDFLVEAPERASEINFDSYSTALDKINENFERVLLKPVHQSKEGADNLSFIPPETASMFTVSNYSTALSVINHYYTELEQKLKPSYNNKIVNDNYQDPEAVEADEGLLEIIIPPDSPRDIDVDSMSLAFASINANSDQMLLHSVLLIDNENACSNLDLDSASI